MSQPLPRPRPQWGATELTDVLKCLSHPRRIQILVYLLKQGPKASFQDISKALKLPAATLSHYLNLYEKSHLISRERHGDKSVMVGLRLDKVEGLAQWFGGVHGAVQELRRKQ